MELVSTGLIDSKYVQLSDAIAAAPLQHPDFVAFGAWQKALHRRHIHCPIASAMAAVSDVPSVLASLEPSEHARSGNEKPRNAGAGMHLRRCGPRNTRPSPDARQTTPLQMKPKFEPDVNHHLACVL